MCSYFSGRPRLLDMSALSTFRFVFIVYHCIFVNSTCLTRRIALIDQKLRFRRSRYSIAP